MLKFGPERLKKNYLHFHYLQLDFEKLKIEIDSSLFILTGTFKDQQTTQIFNFVHLDLSKAKNIGFKNLLIIQYGVCSEAYPETFQTTQMELFAKKIYRLKSVY